MSALEKPDLSRMPPPKMTSPGQLARLRALALLCELVERGEIVLPVVESANAGGIIVTISIMATGKTPVESARLLLHGIKKTAYDHAPKTGETPVTIKRLAAMCGYAYGSHFRDAVRSLCDDKLLVRVSGGVRQND
jgi:hypothetical protein